MAVCGYDYMKLDDGALLADALRLKGYSGEVITPEDAEKLRPLLLQEPVYSTFQTYLQKLTNALIEVAADGDVDRMAQYVGYANAYLALSEALAHARKVLAE